MRSRCKERHAASCQATDLSRHFCRPEVSDGSDRGSSFTKCAEEPKFCAFGTYVLRRSCQLFRRGHPILFDNPKVAFPHIKCACLLTTCFPVPTVFFAWGWSVKHLLQAGAK